MPDQMFLAYQSNNEALEKLTDAELKELLKKASRGTVRCMGDMSMRKIESALLSLGIDPAEVKGLGDKRKKTTLLKVAIASLSTINKDMDKAIDELSYHLGLQDPQYLDQDEKERHEKAIEAIETEATVPTVAKKQTKVEAKAQKQKELNSKPAIVKWECDFAGEVSIGNEIRDFWVQDPYSDPIVNLVTSNGTVILSAWESTKENPFMRAVIREFHELLASRGDNRPTSTTEPTVIRRVDADGSTRMIINTQGGNYNERIEGDYIQGSDTRR